MRSQPIFAFLLAAAVWLGPAAVSALACPFCGEANAVDGYRSNAFQFSILFMMGMPIALAAVFGYGFYRLSRQAQAATGGETSALGAPVDMNRVDGEPAEIAQSEFAPSDAALHSLSTGASV